MFATYCPAVEVATHCRAAAGLLLDGAESARDARTASTLDNHSRQAQALSATVLADPTIETLRSVGDELCLIKAAAAHHGVPSAAAQLQAALVLAKQR